MGCLSRMRGNLHVRFLGEGVAARPSPYPTHDEGSIPFTRSTAPICGVPQKSRRICKSLAHNDFSLLYVLLCSTAIRRQLGLLSPQTSPFLRARLIPDC